MTSLRAELKKFADPKKAKVLQGFFKTGPGQYGEGDVFLGLKVGDTRLVAKKFTSMPLEEVKSLLESKIHEERLAALLVLVEKFGKAGNSGRKQIFDFYLANAKNVNNWDLVDLSAPKISGEFLLDRDRAVLFRLVRSENLWKKRIAVLSTFTFIRNNDFDDALAISEILLNDSHDLIHKAVGWMLREVGKRNLAVEEGFLKRHYKGMPRTMLRYAIERFPEGKRKAYLAGIV